MRMRKATAIIAGVVLASGLAFVIFLAVIGGNWRWGVEVHNASLITPDVIEFVVDSCHQGAGVSRFQETPTQLRIKVTHQVALFQGGLDCQEAIFCQLQEPLGSRTVIDLHTGDRVWVDSESPPFLLGPKLRDSLNPCVKLDEAVDPSFKLAGR